MGPPLLRHRYTGLVVKGIRDFEIIYEDVFSLKALMIHMREWLIQEGFANRDDHTFEETLYLQRNSPQGKTIHIRWRVNKMMDNKAGLFYHHIDIDFHIKGMQEVEFMHQGQKIKAEKGELKLLIGGKLIIDRDNIWGGHQRLGRYSKFLINGLFRLKHEAQIVEVAQDTEKFNAAIKEHLNIHSFFSKQSQDFWAKRPGAN